MQVGQSVLHINGQTIESRLSGGMNQTFCLGQFITPISSSLPASSNRVPQVGFLQRGRHRVHVFCAPQHRVGDLSQIASNHLGHLLGPISTCSAPISCNEISPTDISLIKLRAFVVSTGGNHKLRGCVFSLSERISQVQAAFAASQIELAPIWNHNLAVFFDIPHVMIPISEQDTNERRAWAEPALQQCHTQLKLHQLDALEFLRKNESSGTDPLLLWNHPTNAWIRDFMCWCHIDITPDSQEHKLRGSILADDMGLGKTLTTLVYILATSDLAIDFHWANWEEQSAATLVVCPLATLSNWENKIKIHFSNAAIPYVVFHGPERKKLSRKDLQTSLVVLTTYKMISGSGKGDQLTIKSLDIRWFRIVLDEAHMIRNPSATRTHSIQELQSEFVLLLTGTPVQNHLTNLQSLVAMLKILPWDQEVIWKRCLIPNMNVGAVEAIKSLTTLMHSICLRRTKSVLLTLPPKVEKAIAVQNSPQWEEVSSQLHASFIRDFGRLRNSDQPWQPAEFFHQLRMI
ncbi:hypothetical protein PTTG_25100 [Puccinia triticina 1-1 BBBD Race 1]|uniref:Helicase ATP-binding domain-containing protein n=1 Tax=Puccinia triticina (isolate 1-1 / race 1 (BBBD)) TaxID=630390 RepID=A0A180H4J0_PUCT1|nr:hypothetical protein PTTG_25100 [Puccinia triticina 1-1 BBBD Race 1]